MALRVALKKVRITDDFKNTVETHTDVLLEFAEKQNDIRFYIVSNQTKEDLLKGYLDEYEHIAESSNAGSIDCFENSKDKMKIIIFYNETEAGTFLDYMRRYCSGERPKLPSPPKTVPTHKINQFIQAVNNQKQEEAKRLAEDLARDRVEVRFTLDVVQAGDAKPEKKPEPVPIQQPINVEIAIESFLTGANDAQKYRGSILPGTKISDLKQMVSRETSINPEQQFWFIDRDFLNDDYICGVTPPKLNPGTVLTVFIAKPKAN